MRRQLVSALAIAACVATAVVSARHFSLVKSLPAAGAKVEASPDKLQLWFSQTPAAGVSQIRLGPAADDKVEIEIGKTTIDAGEKSLTAAVPTPLAPGTYAIRWRGAGDDGHVMTGKVEFTVVPTSAR